MKTHSSHGPTGHDADEWRRLLTHFNQPSVELAKTVAKIARRLATSVIPMGDLEAYNACRLIPLDKNPGVRPIGIGEVIRRIIGRSITECIKTDLNFLAQIISFALDRNAESNMQSTPLEMLTRKTRIKEFCLLMQKTPLTLLIESSL